jgi:hypothetical protein
VWEQFGIGTQFRLFSGPCRHRASQQSGFDRECFCDEVEQNGHMKEVAF